MESSTLITVLSGKRRDPDKGVHRRHGSYPAYSQVFNAVKPNGKTLPDDAFVNKQGLSRKHIFDSVQASLKRLDMDYIDVLQCHRFDPNTPIAETVRPPQVCRKRET